MIDTQTNFGPMLRLLEENRMSQMLPQKCNLMIIGPGGDSGLGFMPYELYETAAYLEAEGIDYSLTVVDIVEDIIEKVRTRRHLGVSLWDLSMRRGSELFENYAWPRYCEITGRTPVTWPNQEVYWVRIPKGLERRLDQGDITLIHSDISEAKLPTGSDLVIARNVMCQVVSERQEQTYTNIANSMAPGSLLWTNYGKILMGTLASHDNMRATMEEPWFTKTGLKENHVLFEVNGIPYEWLYQKNSK